MIYHAIPTIERKPEIIICHTGTNDITNKIDKITNCQIVVNKIKKKSPHTKIVISSLITRKDKPGYDEKVKILNAELKKFCNENLIDFISHGNIDETCLSFKKLHLNKKFLNYINSISSELDTCILDYSRFEINNNYLFEVTRNTQINSQVGNSLNFQNINLNRNGKENMNLMKHMTLILH